MSKNRFTPFFKPYGPNRKRVYVSGPMTGYDDYNFPAFHEAAAALRELGYAVCSPAETDQFLGVGLLTHAEYLRFDFERVLEADFLVALPEWQRSKGALAELHVATRIGTKCWTWDDFESYNLISIEEIEKCLGVLSVES